MPSNAQDTNTDALTRLPVLILGTTLFSEEIADLIQESHDLVLAGFVENLVPEKCPGPMLGQQVRWIADLAHIDSKHHLICGIGTTQRRHYVEQVRSYGLPFATLRHPSSHASASSRIGTGSILGINSILAAHSELGEHVIVNRAATIGHHTRIGNYVNIGPGANIAGRCEIGDGVYIGMGAIVVDGISIGADSVVGAGAVVTRDVPCNVQVVGIPARIVKEGIDGR